MVGCCVDQVELDFEVADVHRAIDDTRETALVGGDAGRDEGVITGVDGRTAGEQLEGLGGPAVESQRTEERVDVE